MTFAYI